MGSATRRRARRTTQPTENALTLRILDMAFDRALDRRHMLRGVALSAGAIGLLGACASAGAANPANDVAILNVALGLEHEAITAYQLGAQSGLLQKPVLDVAVAFQSHHKEHRDALVATIRKLGGSPVGAKSDAEVAQALNAAALKNQT